MRQFLFSISLILFSIAPLCSANPETYRAWHNTCLNASSTKEIDEKIEVFRDILRKSPKDYLAEAYLGSALALRSRKTFWGPSKLKYLHQGRDHLNHAVASAPRDPRVRMVRAIGYYSIPEKLGVRPVALEDFSILIPIAKKPTPALSDSERQAILYYGWQAHMDANKSDADSLKAASHEIAPSTYYGKKTK